MVCFARQAALYWDWQKYCPQILWNMVRFLHFPACGRWKERDFSTMINTINLIECGNQSLKQPYLKHQLSLTHENPSDGAFTKCISPLIQILEGPAPSLGFLFGTFSCCYSCAKCFRWEPYFAVPCTLNREDVSLPFLLVSRRWTSRSVQPKGLLYYSRAVFTCGGIYGSFARGHT